jgi:mono/diheme cytochrome c family protein
MRTWMKRLGVGLGGVVCAALLAVGVVYAATEMRLRRTFEVPLAQLAVRTDSAALARGRHVAVAIGKCVDCHGDDLGGKPFIEAPPLAMLYASNLTRGKGGVGAAYSDAQLLRAIRHGVSAEGRPLLFMPSNEFFFLNDEDAASLVAYVRSLPPVDRELPASKVGPVGRGLYLTGQLPLVPAELIDHSATRPAPPAGATREYGAYLARVGGCQGCHGETLGGGPIPGTPPEWPPASNLTPSGLAHYDEAAFFRAMREGVRPGGSRISDFMPYRLTKEMSDEEIRALWIYLRSVPKKEFGAR